MAKRRNDRPLNLEAGLPSSRDAEVAILGAILLDNFLYNEAAELLAAEDFDLDSHRRIFARMTELAEKSQPIDLVSLAEVLSKRKEVDAVGGIAYISSLTDGLPRRPNIAHYTRIVRDKSRARTTMHTCSRAINSLSDHEQPDEVIGKLFTDLAQVVERGKDRDQVDIKTAAMAMLDRLHLIRRTDRKCIGYTTGLANLDLMTTGYRRKEFCIIAARTGMGKSSLMLQAATDNAVRFKQENSGEKVLVATIEMSREQFIERAASRATGINYMLFRNGRLSDDDMDRITAAAAELSQLPLIIDDVAGMSLSEMAARIRMHAARGAVLCFVDYLQIIEVPGIEKRNEQVSRASRTLRDIGKTSNIAMVALSQLRRPKEGSENREPVLSDLKESGDIENDADAVLMIHRPKDDHGFTGNDKVVIGKQRSGPSDIHAKVSFKGPTLEFASRDEDWVPVSAHRPSFLAGAPAEQKSLGIVEPEVHRDE